MAAMHEIDYILATTCSMSKWSWIRTKPRSRKPVGMMYMDDGIEMETIFGDGSQQQGGFLGALMSAGKRVLTGESLFMTVFLNRSGEKKKVAFGAPFPGKIVAIHLAEIGGQLIAQKDRFWRRPKASASALRFSASFGALEGSADGLGLAPEMFLAKKPAGGYTKALRIDLLLRKIQSGSQLFDPAPDDCLLAHLRDHQHGDSMIEALVDAVHAAVSQEDRSAPQDVQLRHVRPHDEVPWDIAQGGRGDGRSHRKDDLAIQLREGLETAAVKARIRVEKSPQRCVDQDGVLYVLPRENIRLATVHHGRADELETIVEAVRAGLKMAGSVDDIQIRTAGDQLRDSGAANPITSGNSRSRRIARLRLRSLATNCPALLGRMPFATATSRHDG